MSVTTFVPTTTTTVRPPFAISIPEFIGHPLNAFCSMGECEDAIREAITFACLTDYAYQILWHEQTILFRPFAISDGPVKDDEDAWLNEQGKMTFHDWMCE